VNRNFSSGLSGAISVEIWGHGNGTANLLLDLADLNAKDSSGHTSLHCAATASRSELVASIYHDANLEITADRPSQFIRCTALMCAVAHNDLQITRLPWEANAKPSVRDSNGSTPLTMLKMSKEEIPRRLTGCGGGAGTGDKYGCAGPLNLAVFCGYEDVIGFLMGSSKPPSINWTTEALISTSSITNTAMHCSCQ